MIFFPQLVILEHVVKRKRVADTDMGINLRKQNSRFRETPYSL